MDSPGFSIFNQPMSFYFGTGLKNLVLFKTPVQPAFDRSYLPVFYSDTWGDYWCYFTCVINVTAPGMALNRQQITPFLAKVNIVSIYPTLLLLAGFGAGGISFLRLFKRRKQDNRQLFESFLFIMAACSWAGYMVFLISYPGNPLTNKATYMIQVFMILPVLAGILLEKVSDQHPILYRCLIIALVLAFIHNLPAFFTHFHWMG
jgi:hypothetical protein